MAFYEVILFEKYPFWISIAIFQLPYKKFENPKQLDM